MMQCDLCGDSFHNEELSYFTFADNRYGEQFEGFDTALYCEDCLKKADNLYFKLELTPFVDDEPYPIYAAISTTHPNSTVWLPQDS